MSGSAEPMEGVEAAKDRSAERPAAGQAATFGDEAQPLAEPAAAGGHAAAPSKAPVAKGKEGGSAAAGAEEEDPAALAKLRSAVEAAGRPSREPLLVASICQRGVPHCCC
jgi:hypothetical protein